MKNKQIIKNVFDEEFDIESMKSQILLKAERKHEKVKITSLKYLVPICLMIVICGIMVLRNNNEELKTNIKNNKENNIVNINKVDRIGQSLIDADMKEISNIEKMPWFQLLSEIKVPKDLYKFESYGIYTRKDQNSSYDILNCYVYSYFNTELNKDIRISFSENNKPVRDYHFDEIGKTSKINDIELSIYQYENSYMTEFSYKNYNFDIETNNITLEEFIILLESIIK